MKGKREMAIFLSLALLLGWAPVVSQEDENTDGLTDDEEIDLRGSTSGESDEASVTCHETERAVMQPPSRWTVLLYLNGDNYAYADAQRILNEVKMVGSSNEVIIAALIDGDSYGDTRLYYIENNLLEELEWPTESDMGDEETLKQFAEKVMEEYPSEHYGLILTSDHGSGWQGVCWDGTSSGSIITMPELASALNEITENGTRKLGLIGFDMCMTGMMEVAYQVRPYCEYIVASEECMLWGIWPFSEPLSGLRNNPDMTPRELAVCIVDHFEPEIDPQYGLKTTLSAIDLSEMDELGNAIDEIALLLRENVEKFKDEIGFAASNRRKYAKVFRINYYGDLCHFIELLMIEEMEVKEAKNRIISVMNKAVIANAHVEGDNSGGLSIYFPLFKEDYNSSLWYAEIPSPYEELMFAQDTNWDEFLKAYLDCVASYLHTLLHTLLSLLLWITPIVSLAADILDLFIPPLSRIAGSVILRLLFLVPYITLMMAPANSFVVGPVEALAQMFRPVMPIIPLFFEPFDPVIVAIAPLVEALAPLLEPIDPIIQALRAFYSLESYFSWCKPH